MRVITSASAGARLEAAREFLGGRPPATELVIVAASRGAAVAYTLERATPHTWQSIVSG